MKLFKTISKGVYNWTLESQNDDYMKYFSIDADVFPGMKWAFGLLVVVSLLTAIFFYYVFAKNVNNISKKNYVIIGLFGLIILVVFNFVLFYVGSKYDSGIFISGNMWRLTVINIPYYIILFELISIFIKDKSNAKNTHLFS